MPPLVYLLATAVFAQGTSEFMLGGLLDDIAADFDTTVPRAGLLTSAFAVGMIVGAPTMAIATRRLPPRLALSVFSILFIAMHVIGATTNSYAMLFTSRVAAAFANAGFLAVTLATVTALVAPDRTSRAIATILAGTTLALVLGVPAGTLIGALVDWRAALWGVALLSVPALAAVAIAAPDRRNTLSHTSLTAELVALQSRPLIRVLILCAVVNSATFCAFTYLAPIVTERTGLQPVHVPPVLALFGVGALCGVWATGRFADRHASAILLVAGVTSLAGWCLFAALAQFTAAVFALAFVQGGLSFALGSTLVGQVMHAAAKAPTMSGSYATASLNIGAAAGPVLGGWAYNSTLGPVGPLLASAALTAVALILRTLST